MCLNFLRLLHKGVIIDKVIAALQPHVTATWAASAPAREFLLLITLPNMVDSPRILTWYLAEIKQFNKWCQAHQVNEMSTQEQWSLIVQCFSQDTLDVMEKIVRGKCKIVRKTYCKRNSVA